MQIRLASLLPETLDLAAAARDLELLTERLAQVPGFTFARLIRDVLVRARRRRVLPPIAEEADGVPPAAPYVAGRYEAGRLQAPAESRARLEPLPLPPPRQLAKTAQAAQVAQAPGTLAPLAPPVSPAPSAPSAPSLSPTASTLDSTLFSGSPQPQPTPQHRAQALPYDGADAAPPVDFMYAEQLWPKASPPANAASAAPLGDAFALDAWFPFPPLGELFSW